MTRPVLPLITAILVLAPAIAKGQPLPVQPLPPAPPAPDRSGVLSLSVENDVLSGTDRYYTNGIQLTYFSPSADLPAPLAWLDRQLDGLLGPGELRWGLTLGHAIYTPQNTSLRVPDPRDRPYAGFLYGSAALARDAGTSFTLFELQVGLIGPSALGEEVQNNFHDLIGDKESRGWRFQLRDEPIVNAVFSRVTRVPLLQFAGLTMEALPSYTLAAGNANIYAGAGGVLRIGQGLAADYGPARIRPALSGSAFFQPRGNEFGWYVFAGVEGRAEARDIFLDGNTWRDSRSVDRRPLVGDAQFGATVMWQGVRLSYTHVLRTEEFYGQRGGVQAFSSLNVAFRF